MIVCLKTRMDEIHIINWTAGAGIHYTLCGKSFTNKQNIETFSCDNTFPDMCPVCYYIQEGINDDTVQSNVREWLTDNVITTTVGEYTSIQMGWSGTAQKFSNLEDRYWPKSRRMRRKFPGKETKKSTRKQHGFTFSKAFKIKYK
jgi:hypothetical protein